MPINHWRRHSRHDTKIGPLMDTIKLSKKLSYVLRHKPQSIGLKLDKSGWANVNDILAKMGMTQTELDQVVADNNSLARTRGGFVRDRAIVFRLILDTSHYHLRIFSTMVQIKDCKIP